MRHYLLKLSLSFVLLTGVYAPLAAQGDSANDPLKKPKVWDLLLDSPADSSLWASYVGKPWVTMTYVEKENIGRWRQGLRGSQSSRVDEAGGFADNGAAEMDLVSRQVEKKLVEENTQRLKDEQIAYLIQLEQMMLEEPPFLVDLKSNVAANFIIIDDTYREEFEAVGIEYVDYATAHPDGRYSKEQWVAEKDNQLKQIKQKQLNTIKQQLIQQNR